MDHICTSAAKFKKLSDIAQLSANQLVDVDEYVKLASIVQSYVNNPSDELFDKLTAQLQLCSIRVPTFSRVRHMLISLLMDMGYLTKSNPGQPEKQPDNSVENQPKEQEPEISTPNIAKNVYNIFTKKNVDVDE